MSEPVVVNYFNQMRVQRVFPLTVDLHPVPGTLTGRVQVRPVIPGALVTPSIREVDLSSDGSFLNFAVTAMACGQLPNARLGMFQDGRHVGNVALEMKGVRQLDSWIFLLLAILTPVMFYFFLNHLDWSRSGNVHLPPAPPVRMPIAEDTPPNPELGKRAAGMQAPAGARISTDTPSLPKEPPKLLGTIERTIVADVPDFQGYTRPVAAQMQDCYEVIQQSEKSYRISLFIALGFLALALISGFVNRTTRTQLRSQLSEAG